MFDTHCHLTSKRLRKDLDGVVTRAQEMGVDQILVPGTSEEDSRIAVEIAEKYVDIYAAVGIHPEEIISIFRSNHSTEVDYQIQGAADKFRLGELERMLETEKVVAVGEIGMDDQIFNMSSPTNFSKELLMTVQKQLLIDQVRLAVKYEKSLILHNRGMGKEMMEILEREWSTLLSDRTVFHCCEADERLLAFAVEKRVYVGVDGDVTYNSAKQNFVKKVPLEILVLETDAPYLLPEPMLSEKKYPNEPGNLRLIAEKVAELKGLKIEEVGKVTTENGMRLFEIPSL